MSKKSQSKKGQTADTIIESGEYDDFDEIINNDENEFTDDDIEDIQPTDEATLEPESVTPEPESATVPSLTNKQKAKAVRRSIENKKMALDRETRKVKEWRVQAKDRDEKATAEYQKRKSELEEMLRKSEERYTKRMAKTKKWWHEYSDNYEATKIQKIENDIILLTTELQKYEDKPEEATN